MTIHKLKTDPVVFSESWDEKKCFEIRKDDRNFAVNDVVILCETLHPAEDMKTGNPLIFTGRQITGKIIYILKEKYGLKDGYCILEMEFDTFNYIENEC